jgi:hypothetical protein
LYQRECCRGRNILKLLFSEYTVNINIEDPTFRNTESNAAEYLNPLSSLSYPFSRFFLLLSTLNSSASPLCFAMALSRIWPCPILGKPPRKDSKTPELTVSEALGCRRRTDRVPSDIPAARCVSSGCVRLSLAPKAGIQSAYRDSYAENWGRISHSVCNFIRPNIVYLDHVVKTTSQNTPGIGTKSQRRDRLLVIR